MSPKKSLQGGRCFIGRARAGCRKTGFKIEGDPRGQSPRVRVEDMYSYEIGPTGT